MNLSFLHNLRERSARVQALSSQHNGSGSFEDGLFEALRHDPILVAPYTKDYPEHLAALPNNFVRVYCGDDEFAYTRLLSELSLSGKTVVIIEHDVVPLKGSVDALLACPYPWCGYPTSTTQGVKVCLGFVKFAAGTLPAIDKSVSWHRLDGFIEQRLKASKLTVHIHQPEMLHINPMIELHEEPHLDDTAQELMLRNLHIFERNA